MIELKLCTTAELYEVARKAGYRTDKYELDVPKLRMSIEAQAKLTAQQIYEWGNEPCPHKTVELSDGTFSPSDRRDCDRCWQELNEVRR